MQTCHIKKLEDIACFCHHLTLPRTFHVYGDLYWKDTFWTISFLYYNLSTIRGYHHIVYIIPHTVAPKCAGNICTFWADSKFVLATPSITHIWE